MRLYIFICYKLEPKETKEAKTEKTPRAKKATPKKSGVSSTPVASPDIPPVAPSKAATPKTAKNTPKKATPKRKKDADEEVMLVQINHFPFPYLLFMDRSILLQ
jgi:hypothetical protein